jgi:hypothetical protein
MLKAIIDVGSGFAGVPSRIRISVSAETEAELDAKIEAVRYRQANTAFFQHMETADKAHAWGFESRAYELLDSAPAGGNAAEIAAQYPVVWRGDEADAPHIIASEWDSAEFLRQSRGGM